MQRGLHFYLLNSTNAFALIVPNLEKGCGVRKCIWLLKKIAVFIHMHLSLIRIHAPNTLWISGERRRIRVVFACDYLSCVNYCRLNIFLPPCIWQLRFSLIRILLVLQNSKMRNAGRNLDLWTRLRSLIRKTSSFYEDLGSARCHLYQLSCFYIFLKKPPRGCLVDVKDKFEFIFHRHDMCLSL